MPSSHLELAMICEAVWDAAPTADATSIEWGGRQVPIILYRVGSAVYGVAEVDYMIPFRQAMKVNCICFRGSKSPSDFLIDADAILVKTPYGMVHQGFEYDWGVLAQDVGREMEPLIFCGHSLGGAIATRAALSRPAERVLEVVTFGCPRVGDAAFRDAYAPYLAQTTRRVFGHDPVPHVPWWGYRHVKRSCWWDGKEWQDGLHWFEALRQLLKSREGLRAILDEHHIERYIEALT